MPGHWDGSPLHHHAFDEAFYVLDGELTFAPRNAIRTPANLSDRPARYLLICTPGGFERRFDSHWYGSISTDKPYSETHVVGPTIPGRERGPA